MGNREFCQLDGLRASHMVKRDDSTIYENMPRERIGVFGIR
jgi:hypothetical protein